MATVFNLEITDQKIRYVFTSKEGKNLKILGNGESTVNVDSSKPGSLSDFVKELSSSQGIKPVRLFVSLNRKEVFTHQILVPKLSKQELKNVVQAEIEKNLNFSDKDFDFIFQEFPTDESIKSRVVFSAIDQDFLDFLLQEIKNIKIPCQDLSIAPLNLVSLLDSVEFNEGVQAFVVLSELNTHLIVFKHQDIRFYYTSNIGQANLASESAKSSWAEELKRVIKSYSVENKKDFVSKIWFVWDNKKDAQLDELFRREFAFDLRELKLKQDILTDPINPIFISVLIPGLLSLLSLKPAFDAKHFLKTINLSKYIKKGLIGAGIMMFVVLLILIFIFVDKLKKEGIISKEVNSLENQISDLETKSPQLMQIREDYTKARDQLLFQATYVKLLNRMSWSETLSVVATELPEELSLTSFKVSDIGQVTFTGEAFRMESVSQLLRKIETSVILKEGKFNYLTQEEMGKRKIYRFGILANIKLSDEK